MPSYSGWTRSSAGATRLMLGSTERKLAAMSSRREGRCRSSDGALEYGDEDAGAQAGVEGVRPGGRPGARPGPSKPLGGRGRDGSGGGAERLGEEHAADDRGQPGRAD